MDELAHQRNIMEANIAKINQTCEGETMGNSSSPKVKNKIAATSGNQAPPRHTDDFATAAPFQA